MRGIEDFSNEIHQNPRRNQPLRQPLDQEDYDSLFYVSVRASQ
jgi:hypothetical protein